MYEVIVIKIIVRDNPTALGVVLNYSSTLSYGKLRMFLMSDRGQYNED